MYLKIAYMHILITIVAVAAALAPTLATDYSVGDDMGWKLNVDYEKWARGKTFYVGDKLIFRYPQGAHNVHKVNGTGFQQCAPQDGAAQALTSGNDEITLATPGEKWYICSIATHCASGMKLSINVLLEVGSPAAAPAPATPTGAASDLAFNTYLAWVTAAFTLISAIIA